MKYLWLCVAVIVTAVNCADVVHVLDDSTTTDFPNNYLRIKETSEYKNVKPLIGVLTQPCSSHCPGRSYIAASYVKWVEAAGARVVPIRYYASEAELHRLFKSINGLIFPGGLTWLWLDSPYVLAARKLFNWAVEANDAGDVFPIHGTCLGHQLLHILVSNVSRDDLLIETDSVAQRSTLLLTDEGLDSSYFGTMLPSLKDKLGDQDLALATQNHFYSVPPSHYEQWPILKDFFSVVSYSKDRKNVTYISTVEAKKYPFFGTQWHPEKPASEFMLDVIPHTLDAVMVGQQLANMFVDIARYSSHKPESPEEEISMLIYSTAPVFTARFQVTEANYDGPDITYFFDEPTGTDPFPPGADPEDVPQNNTAKLDKTVDAQYAHNYNNERSGFF